MTTTQSCPALTAPQEIGRLQIGGHSLRVLNVDAVLPRHTMARDGGRLRLSYVDGEIAHFELQGRRYALALESDETHPRDAASSAAATGDEADIRQLLTNRELQIVQLICMGCLTKQVADRLRISEFTVRSYLKTVYCKLGVRSRGAMVYRYASSFTRHPGPGG